MRNEIGGRGLAAIVVAMIAVAVTVAQAPPAPKPAEPATAANPATPTAGPTPKIRIEPAEWDFGEVWYGTPLQNSDTKVTNVGDAPLKITAVRKFCGCTSASVDKNELAPGESTKLHIVYDSTKGTEAVQQTVRVESNDPAQPAVSFLVKGTCKPMFEFETEGKLIPVPGMRFGQLDKNEVKTNSVKITSLYKEGPVHLKLKDMSPSMYKFELKELEAGKVYELVATTKPPLSAGSTVAVAHLESDLDFLKDMKVRINGYVVPPVRVTPPQITVSPKTTFESVKDVSIVYRVDKPIKITKVECDDPRVHWEIVEVPQAQGNSPNAFHRLRVTVPPGAEVPDKGMKLTIHTDCQDAEYQKLDVAIVKITPRRVGTGHAVETKRGRATRDPRLGNRGTTTRPSAEHVKIKTADQTDAKNKDNPAKPDGPGGE